MIIYLNQISKITKIIIVLVIIIIIIVTTVPSSVLIQQNMRQFKQLPKLQKTVFQLLNVALIYVIINLQIDQLIIALLTGLPIGLMKVLEVIQQFAHFQPIIIIIHLIGLFLIYYCGPQVVQCNTVSTHTSISSGQD